MALMAEAISVFLRPGATAAKQIRCQARYGSEIPVI
jgi:hypothetical protein